MGIVYLACFLEGIAIIPSLAFLEAAVILLAEGLDLLAGEAYIRSKFGWVFHGKLPEHIEG